MCLQEPWDLKEGVLLEQLEDLVLVVELGDVDGRLPIQVLECDGSTMLQEKIDALLAPIASSVMQRGVLVLVQSVHCCTGLKKDLGTLQLTISTCKM